MTRAADEPLLARLGPVLGREPLELRPLSGGMVGSVLLAQLDGDERVVVKTSPGTPLTVEARMLEYLAGHSELPVPAVVHATLDLLVLEYLPGSSDFDDGAQRHAAELLASLHSQAPTDGVSGSGRFGLAFDTLIGPLVQPNGWTDDWAQFYGERRLLPATSEATRRGRLPEALRNRLLRLADDLPQLLGPEPRPAGLVHGDIWTGNVLAQTGRISAFLDPAIYYADPEVELAYIELFATFGTPFWRRYQEFRPIDDGYSALRRDLYQLYPLLVHVALFGGGYVSGVEERLGRLGY